MHRVMIPRVKQLPISSLQIDVLIITCPPGAADGNRETGTHPCAVYYSRCMMHSVGAKRTQVWRATAVDLGGLQFALSAAHL